MEKIAASELILNEDQSVYHLHLQPADIGDLLFFVGDPDRVPEVSKHFDRITLKKQKREFVTHSGYIGRRYVSVLSTGIGTDNIDIVLNELDALANIDLEKRELKQERRSLKIVRIGTSGSLQRDVPVGSILASSYGLGLDNLMNFYTYESDAETALLRDELDRQLDLGFARPYLFKAPGTLAQHYPSFMSGITATCCGFYAPQGRVLRGQPAVSDLIGRLHRFQHDGLRISNFEMETAGIYGLAALYGHEALSVNAIMANRVEHVFASAPGDVMERTIVTVLEQAENL